MDVVARVNGRVMVVEHKFTSADFSPGSTYRRALHIDTQISAYYVGARLLGHDVDGVIYDCIAKPALVPLKATPIEDRRYTIATKSQPSRPYANVREADETIDECKARTSKHVAERRATFFARFEVVRLLAEEDAAAEDLWGWGEMIRDARRLNRWPRNPISCHAHHRACPFLDACEGTASLDDPTLYRRAERVHEELSASAG